MRREERVNPIWVPFIADTWDENGNVHGKLLYYNTETGETREPLPYSSSGYPMCHDILYITGVLGDTCHDEGDYPTDDNYTPTPDDDNDNKCSNKPGSAGMSGPFNKKTECELEEWTDCKNDSMNGIKWNDRCKDINYAFTDACDEFAFVQDCIDNYSNPKDPVICQQYIGNPCIGGPPSEEPIIGGNETFTPEIQPDENDQPEPIIPEEDSENNTEIQNIIVEDEYLSNESEGFFD